MVLTKSTTSNTKAKPHRHGRKKRGPRGGKHDRGMLQRLKASREELKHPLLAGPLVQHAKKLLENMHEPAHFLSFKTS
jgi:hypothetical protein